MSSIQLPSLGTVWTTPHSSHTSVVPKNTKEEVLSPLDRSIRDCKRELEFIERDTKCRKEQLSSYVKNFEKQIEKNINNHEQLTKFLEQLQSLKDQDEGTKESSESISDS